MHFSVSDTQLSSAGLDLPHTAIYLFSLPTSKPAFGKTAPSSLESPTAAIFHRQDVCAATLVFVFFQLQTQAFLNRTIQGFLPSPQRSTISVTREENLCWERRACYSPHNAAHCSLWPHSIKCLLFCFTTKQEARGQQGLCLEQKRAFLIPLFTSVQDSSRRPRLLPRVLPSLPPILALFYFSCSFLKPAQTLGSKLTPRQSSGLLQLSRSHPSKPGTVLTRMHKKRIRGFISSLLLYSSCTLGWIIEPP